MSSSDLTSQAREASMIVTMRRLERALVDTDRKAERAHQKARLKFALSAVAHVALSAIATAIGAYVAVKGIHL